MKSGILMSSNNEYKGRTFSVSRRKVTTPFNQVVDKDVIKEPNMVSIVGLTKDNTFVVSHQYKSGSNFSFNSVPSGEIKEGESAKEAAERVLEELTGYLTTDLVEMCEIYVNEERSTAKVTCFIAKISPFTRTYPTNGTTSELVSKEKLLEMTINQEIQDSISVSAISYALLSEI